MAMNTAKLFFILLIIAALTSCVSSKQFNDQNKKLDAAKAENEALKKENMELAIKNTETEAALDRLKQKNETLLTKNKNLLYQQEVNSRAIENLNNEKTELGKQIEALRAGSSTEIKKLLEQLQETMDELNIREDKLKKAEEELEARNTRLIELKEILKQKDLAVKELKTKVSDALTGFTNNGLTVYEKNGKVYVSLEEQLLFKTGKWDVDQKGQQALRNLAEVLAQNPEINIMVEGHTDNVPMQGSGEVKDNWDLSVMRATAVTKILTQNTGVGPSRIISAGRSEYVPVDSADTPEARQKNRRTEIILTPKLDELLKIIELN